MNHKRAATAVPQDEQGRHSDGLGRKAGTVYFDALGHRREVTPLKVYDADGHVLATGHEADAALSASIDEVHEHNRQALAQLKPHELARFEAWLRTRTHATPPVRPPSTTATSGLATGRAPREARNDRHRGSRRTTGSGSTSSGEDDPEPEPPGARLCAECGQPVEPNSRGRPREYCKGCSTPAARKRRERENDRQHPERVVEREGEIWSLAPECSCGSEAAEPDYVLGYYRCIPCGLKRPEPEARLLDYRAGKNPLPARSFVPAHGLKKRNPRFGDYKRKPVTLKKRLSSGEVVPV